MLDETEVQQIVQQAESLLDKVERLEDEQARLIAVNAVQALMALYGEALGRIVNHVGEDEALLKALASDELVSHLLLVHDLHPVPLEERVRRALHGLEGYLQSQEATAELVDLREGVATVRLDAGSGGGRQVHETVQRVVLRAAPELVGAKIHDASSPTALQKPAAFVPLETLTPRQEMRNSD